MNKNNMNIRKFHEYEMKIVKMAGHVSDYYIDRAIESDDFSVISGFLIDHFSGDVGKSFDIGYLASKYEEFELNEKVEDLDFNVAEWYKLIYETEKMAYDNVKPLSTEDKQKREMSDEEYLQYMIDKRKKEIDE